MEKENFLRLVGLSKKSEKVDALEINKGPRRRK